MIVNFPMKETRIKEWYDTAVVTKKSISEIAALQWIKKHVPYQFQHLIVNSIRGVKVDD